MNQKIILGKGLADLPFGATRDEVLKVLGEPEEKDSVDLGDEESIAWHYWDLGLSLNFDESAAYGLCTIEVGSPEVTLFGEKLIGKSKVDALAFLDQQKIGKHVPETSRGISYPDVELTLWFNGGEVAELQWSAMD